MASYLLLLLIIQTVTSFKSPVIVLDPKAALRKYTNISINPFHVTRTEEFTNLIHEAIHQSETILIFVEESLSVEDVAFRDSFGTPFKDIHRSFLEEKAKFIRSVPDAFTTLQKLLPPLESNVIYIGDVMKPLNKHFKYHYIYFTGAARSTEPRVQRLRYHDALVVQTVENLAKQHTGPVMAFYTGKSSPQQRVGRSPYQRPKSTEKKTEGDDSVMIITDKALIKLSGVVLQQGSKRTSLYQPESSSAQEFLDKRINARMRYHDDVELDFNFEYSDDGWTVESVVLIEGGEEVGRTSMGVGAPYDCSYFCSEPLMIVNMRDKSYVIISKYQLEPLRSEPPGKRVLRDDPETPADPPADAPADPPADKPEEAATLAPEGGAAAKDSFTSTQTCGTHFNVRILMGLFVAALVIAITLSGVIVLMDCGSNDRMDDPNQKPLVIIAQY